LLHLPLGIVSADFLISVSHTSVNELLDRRLYVLDDYPPTLGAQGLSA